MKSSFPRLALFTLAAALAFGCRREDVRVCTIEMPGLTAANAIQMRKATDALGRFRGVDADSYEWGTSGNGNLTLTFKYDSMQIAQTNLRMAIEDKGIRVAYPKKTAMVAGYVDEKAASAD